VLFQVAVDFNYEGKTEAHASQKDHSKGFGGKYGVQSDHMDKVITVIANCSFFTRIHFSACILLTYSFFQVQH